MFRFGETSQKRMRGLHPDLLQVVHRALQLTSVDFMVVEGLRSLPRQRKLVAEGKSRTLNSRHLTGHAIDLCAWLDGELKWGRPYSSDVADAMKRAADELNVELDWGGDWQSFQDTPHFQLSWKAYPKQDASWHSAEQAAMMASSGAPASKRASKRETAKMMRQNSRKFRMADTVKAVQGFLGLTTAGGSVALLNSSKAQLDVGAKIVTSYGWIALLAIGAVFGAVALVMHWLQDKQIEDYENDDYMPSGMSGGAGPGGWL